MTARWDAVSATQVGGRHRLASAPNQDAYAVSEHGEALAVAVADGHGDPVHFRSEPGARLAVELAATLLAQSAADTAVDAAELSDRLRTSVAPALVDRWRGAVGDHVAEHPFTPDETERIEQVADGALHAYGTTVIGLVGSGTALGVLQIGDGDAVVVFANDEVRRLLPDDPANVGVQTSSLCQPDPLVSLRTTTIDLVDRPVLLAWASTDGFGSPRVDEAGWWQQVGHELAGHLRQRGRDWLAAKLPGWLEEPAEYGGDDVTVGLLLAR
jgi:serine/threonine protein phosphatase PrpC